MGETDWGGNRISFWWAWPCSEIFNLIFCWWAVFPPCCLTWGQTMVEIIREFSSVQLLSPVWLFVTPWIAARQASLSITNSQSSLGLMSIESVMPSTISSSVVPFSSHLQSFPTSGSFPMSLFFTSGSQNIGISASASVLPMNIQDLFPLGWTGCIALKSKGLSRVFSNIAVQKHQFFGTWLFL